MKRMETEEPGLVFLDYRMPGLTGLECLKTMQEGHPELPVIMVTARDSEIDKVVGLEMGADDYMTKPFSMRELTARVKALLRCL